MACKLFTWYTGSHCQLFSNALGCLEQMELIPLSPEPCFLEALREGQPEVLQLITQAGSLGDGLPSDFLSHSALAGHRSCSLGQQLTVLKTL